MFGAKARTITRMAREIMRLQHECDAKDAAIASLQKGLAYASDPFNMIRIQDKIEQQLGEAPVVSFPDTAGEPIVPGAFDWERLAHDIYDAETDGGTGGASGSWND